MKSRARTLVVVGFLIVAMFATITTAEAYVYNRQAAVDYARANWNNDVPGSSYFKVNGGDCTNFVSQSLKVGGWRQVTHPTNSALSWYYNGYLPGQYTNSWAGVNPFRNFATASGRSTEVLFVAGTYYLPGTVPIKIGDVIQLDGLGGSFPDGKWDHTMLVTKVYTVQGFKMVKVTYHSYNNLDRDLIQVLNDHPNGRFRALLLKDAYSY